MLTHYQLFQKKKKKTNKVNCHMNPPL